MTSWSLTVVPEVLEVQDIPSEEVRISPPKLTVTNILFPYVIPQSPYDIPEVLEVQVVPSEEVSMVPKSPPTTNVLFP